MKRRVLLTALRRAAKEADVEFSLLRHGASHDIYRIGAVSVVVPRHADINELTARGILLAVAEYLGEGRP